MLLSAGKAWILNLLLLAVIFVLGALSIAYGYDEPAWAYDEPFNVAPVEVAVVADEAIGLVPDPAGDAGHVYDLSAYLVATKGLGDDILGLAERNLTGSGDTVLGHFPGYIDKANARGASYFDIGDAWKPLDDAQRWAANKHFLDLATDQGDRVLLSLPKTEIRPGSWLAREVQYLTQEKGYVWVNQWALVPGG